MCAISSIASWSKSQMIRSYIKEVEKIIARRPDRDTFQEEKENWLLWANRYADQIDPLNKELQFVNDFMKLGK